MTELLVVSAAPVVPDAVLHLQGPGDRHRTDEAASAHALLRLVLTELTGLPPSQHRLLRRCGHCGGQHGKPILVSSPLHVSLATTRGAVMVAVTAVGPVGVDVERTDATRFAGFAGVALAPGERARTPRLRGHAWTRKEAYLKATGQGLSVAPENVDVRGNVVEGPPVARLYDVRVPRGLAAAAAVLSPEVLRLTVERRALPQ